MTVRTQLDAESGVYELGDDIDGVFVPFVSRPESDVQAFVQAAQQPAEPTGAQAAPPATPAEPSPDVASLEAENAQLRAELAAAQTGGTTPPEQQS